MAWADFTLHFFSGSGCLVELLKQSQVSFPNLSWAVLSGCIDQCKAAEPWACLLILLRMAGELQEEAEET